MADDTDPVIQSTPGTNSSATISQPATDDKAPKGRKGKAASETAQAEPTAPRAVHAETGLELDEHGLPLSGPARRRWLRDAGIEDPALKVGADEQENADG